VAGPRAKAGPDLSMEKGGGHPEARV